MINIYGTAVVLIGLLPYLIGILGSGAKYSSLIGIVEVRTGEDRYIGTLGDSFLVKDVSSEGHDLPVLIADAKAQVRLGETVDSIQRVGVAGG